MSRYAALALAYAVFVVYGSLVPLDFHPGDLGEAWARFQQTPFLQLGLESRADWVANGVLYAPMALLVARAVGSSALGMAAGIAFSVLFCSVLAVGVEFTQLFFPPRTVSQNDILAEVIGSIVGAGAAPFLGGWLGRLATAWRHGGQRLLPRLLEVYLAAYLLTCFFPYDLLLTAAEVQDKWQSARWGLWLADTERSAFFVALLWGVEAAVCLPLGALPWFQPAPGAPGRGRWRRALWAGALLGVVIEAGQFFVASGTSQGASVLSRGLGVAAGAALLPWLRTAGLAGVHGFLSRWRWGLWAVYVPTLAAANGLFSHAWMGTQHAAASWAGTQLLPFYYHYYTSEAIALFSLGSVALMYLPAGALVWAGRSVARANGGWLAEAAVWAACAAGLALLVEAAKLFVNGLHPDPTNLLVAAGANGLAAWLACLALRAPQVPPPQPLPPATAVAAKPALPLQGNPAWLLVLPLALAGALVFPVWPLALAALLMAAALVVWRWPVAALGLVPAALPLLDWAPWSGRFFWDEFDLFQTVCLGVAAFRSVPVAATPHLRVLALAFALLGVSLSFSALRSVWPPVWPDLNSFSNFHGGWNALRVGKGALWALAFVWVWRRLETQGPQRARAFTGGMLFALAGTVAVVVWERAAFGELWDFNADFRVSGPFSAMRRGGAYVECFLAVAAAFAVHAVLRARRPVWRAAALMLFAGAAYAVAVTYSRNGYAALAGVVLVSLATVVLPLLHPHRLTRQGLAWAVGSALSVLAVLGAWVAAVGSGDFAAQRLARSGQDLAVRQAHWADALALRDPGWLTSAIGMGVARFPELHYWRSREPARAATYRLVAQGDRTVLRLGAGTTLYVEQLLPALGAGVLQLGLDIRSVPAAAAPPGPQAPAGLGWALCEKWALTSHRCAVLLPGSTSPTSAAPPPAGWQRVTANLDISSLQQATSGLRPPLTLTLMTPGQGGVDVARVSLRSALGEELIANGDFRHGMDRWFFATDVDPPWHIHSLPVAVLFDQGWLGVLAWLAVALTAGGAALAAARRGDALVPAALPALVGFFISGLLNTLIDAPRFLALLLVLLWLAAQRRAPPPQAG